MNTKQLLIGVLATFLTLGLFSTAFASNIQSSEAGNWEYNFDAPETKADEAARSHVYDPDALAWVGTEAGNHEFDFDAPMTKADIAANNHEYDSATLDQVGTEAGVRSDFGVLCSTC